MQIRANNIQPYTAPLKLPARLPDLEVISPQDRLLQSSAGAVACALPTGVGALGSLVGRAVAGPWGQLVGGLVGVAGAAAGAYYGVGAIPCEAPDHQKVMQKQLAVKAGLLAAVGALGGGLAVVGSVAGGALFANRVLDQAESLLAYGPTPPSGKPPEGYEARTLTSSDGKQLQAWFSPEPREAPVALFFHSNATSIEDNLDRLETIRAAGLRVLAVEYRGFGDQSGIPHERGLKRDALAAYGEALKEVPADKIFIMGQSLGGGVAAELAAAKPCAGLVLESSFTSFSEMAKEMGGWAASLTRGRYPTADLLRDISAPVFIAHGSYDSMVPVEMGRTLATRSPHSIYLEVEGAGHMDVYRDPKFGESLQKFVQSTK